MISLLLGSTLAFGAVPAKFGAGVLCAASMFGGQAPAQQPISPSYSVTCDDPDRCSPSVGVMLDAKCTAFAVGPDLIQTSKHCFDVDKKVGDECSSASFVFPAVGGFPTKVAQCLRVVDVSDTVSDSYTIAPDYIVLQTRETLSRPTLDISTQGVPDQTPLVSYQFISTGPNSGQIQSRECTSSMSSMALSLYQTRFSPVVGFPDCPVVGGNSGGPLVDSSGAVRAMYNALFEDSIKYVNGRAQPVFSALATNMACFRSTVLSIEPRSGECQQIYTVKDHYNQEVEIVRSILSSDRSQNEFRRRFRRWQQSRQHSPFGWELKLQGTPENVLYGISRPTCVRTPYLGQRFDVEGLSIATMTGIDLKTYRYQLLGYREEPLHMEVIVDRTGKLTVLSSTSKMTEWSTQLPVCGR